jgi:hypothetical protein
MKNKFIKYLVVSSFIWVLVAPQAEAKTVLRSGENVSISEDQIIEGDFYSAANVVSISGEVAEDVVAAGAEITINGPVGDDALLIAGRTDVHGPVGDDLRVISAEVTIADPVAGDVFVLGGKVTILSTATIGGDLIVYAGQVTVEGLVEGNVVGTVGELRLDSVVKGGVDVTVTELILGDKANIGGDVKYVSEALVAQSLNAVVGGEMVRSDPIIPGKDFNYQTILVPVLILLFSVLAWHLVSKKTLGLVVERSLILSPRPIIFGVLGVLFIPLAAGLLLVSMVGSLVGMVVFLTYILLIVLSLIAFSAVLGKLLMKLFNKPKEEISLFTLVIGVVGVVTLVILPGVGQLVILLLVLLTFGAMVDLLIRPVLK